MQFREDRRPISAADWSPRPNRLVVVWVVVLASLLAVLGGQPLMGYEISGFGWFVPLLFSLFVLVATPGMPKFPYWIWVPWVVFVAAYVFFYGEAANVFQRSTMLVTPLIVGMTVSKSAIGRLELLRIEAILDKFSIAFFCLILIHSGIAATGMLPSVTGLAPEATTASLFAAFFAAKYALGSPKALTKWGLFAAVPVIAVTRTAVVAAGLTLPLTFAPLPQSKRVLTIVAVVALGLLVFHSERVQNKMFYSGEGTIFDLAWDNPDLRTSGRLSMEELLINDIGDSPWFGHGANASEQIVKEFADGMQHPHNDYLRLTFDYGYVGLFLFAFCMVLQTAHAVRAGYRCAGSERLFLLAGAGAFVPFALIMRTDNIILYAAFFGNLHFMILGAGYAAAANEEQVADSAESGWR